MLFAIVGVVGVIFQFIYLYLPLIKLGEGDAAVLADFILIILALAFGGLAIILSIFVIPRNLWIFLVVSVIVFTIIPPIIYSAVMGTFPYVTSFAVQFPYLLVAPTNPLLDFIGFWMAIGGSLIASIIGFTLPRK